MYCPNCGTQVVDGSRFCPNCGSSLAAVTAPQAAPVQAPAAQEFTPKPVWQPAQPQNWQQDHQQAYQQPAQPQNWQQNHQQAYQQPGQPQSWQQDYRQAYQQPAQPQNWQRDDQLSAPVAAETKKRSGKKGLLIGVGCLVLAALIGGGIWFLNRGGLRQNKLIRAAQNSAASFKSYVEELPNLHQIAENAEGLADSSTMHLDYEMQYQMSYSYGGESIYSFAYGYDFHVDADKDTKTLAADGSINTSGTEIPFRLYLSPDQLQASSSMLLDEGEVLSLPLKDLPRQWNASPLSEMADFKLPEDLDLDRLLDHDVEKSLEETYGEDWTVFLKSIKIPEYEGASPFEGKGKTYTLTWDKEALKRMVDKTPELDELVDLDLDSPADLSKIDLGGLSAKLVVALLGEATEAMTAPLFYVENDMLVGVYAAQKTDDGEGTEITVRLLGEENPWERLSVTVHENHGSYTTDDIMTATLKKTGGQLRIEISTVLVDSDYKDDPEEGESIVVIYNDADGRITVEEDGEAVEGLPNLFLVPQDGGFRFSVTSNYDDEDDYSFSSEVVYSVSNRVNAIAPLSAAPTELLKLSEQELRDLFDRIEEKLGQMSEIY